MWHLLPQHPSAFALYWRKAKLNDVVLTDGDEIHGEVQRSVISAGLSLKKEHKFVIQS